jgi:hypothetical protein
MPHKKELSHNKSNNTWIILSPNKKKEKVELSITQPSLFQKKGENYFQQQNRKGKSYNQQSLKAHQEDD